MATRYAGLPLASSSPQYLKNCLWWEKRLLVVGEAAQVTSFCQDDQSDNRSEAGDLAETLVVMSVLQQRVGSRLQNATLLVERVIPLLAHNRRINLCGLDGYALRS